MSLEHTSHEGCRLGRLLKTCSHQYINTSTISTLQLESHLLNNTTYLNLSLFINIHIDLHFLSNLFIMKLTTTTFVLSLSAAVHALPAYPADQLQPRHQLAGAAGARRPILRQGQFASSSASGFPIPAATASSVPAAAAFLAGAAFRPILRQGNISSQTATAEAATFSVMPTPAAESSSSSAAAPVYPTQTLEYIFPTSSAQPAAGGSGVADGLRPILRRE